MGWKRDAVMWLYRRGLLPGQFLKVYVMPRLVQGTTSPYQGARFFESYYKSCAAEGLFSDRITLAPFAQSAPTRFHYNATENSILKCLVRHPVREAPAVLDIGSGAGHWVDFWLDAFDASFVCGIDISATCAESLRAKYAQNDKVVVLEGDISRQTEFAGRKFDVISAIGVMFHIVEDDLWRQALHNMRQLLNDGGAIVVGGHFGWLTQDVQFHVTDDFGNLEQAMGSMTGVSYGLRGRGSGNRVYTNKRVRSLRMWKHAAAEAGLQVQMLQKTMRDPVIPAPESNILLLRAAAR